MAGWDDVPVAVQISFGATAGLGFIGTVLIIGVKRFIKGIGAESAEKKQAVLTDFEVADMGPVRALAPGLQRMYEVQSNIDGKLARILDIFERQAREREEERKIARAIEDDRRNRAALDGH